MAFSLPLLVIRYPPVSAAATSAAGRSRLRFQDHHIPLWPGNKKPVPLAEPQKQFPVLHTFRGLVKLLDLYPLPVPVLDVKS
jgi:hypothetical protein